MSDDLLKDWQAWANPMVSSDPDFVVPTTTAYFKAFKAGWEMAQNRQALNCPQCGILRVEVESLEQQLKDERKRRFGD